MFDWLKSIMGIDEAPLSKKIKKLHKDNEQDYVDSLIAQGKTEEEARELAKKKYQENLNANTKKFLDTRGK